MIEVRSITLRETPKWSNPTSYTLNDCQNKPDFETNECGTRKYTLMNSLNEVISVRFCAKTNKRVNWQKSYHA